MYSTRLVSRQKSQPGVEAQSCPRCLNICCIMIAHMEPVSYGDSEMAGLGEYAASHL